MVARNTATDAAHRDNVGLREAMQRQTPLVYFHGIVPGRYMASWPVYIVGDDPAALTFTVAVDDKQFAAVAPEGAVDAPEAEIRRRYMTRQVRARLHQQAFRERAAARVRDRSATATLWRSAA